jgi:hypothetical protein
MMEPGELIERLRITHDWLEEHDLRFHAANVSEAADALEAALLRISELEEALQVFARCPTHGKRGGPFVIANAIFDDMRKGESAPREAYWHLSDFDRARAVLSPLGG